MKRKFLSVISLLTILLLSACGAASEPTLSAADIANTAVAEAWMMVTLTQAALPTATPVPPTSTPQRTLTFVPTVLVQSTIPPVAAGTPTADQCNQVPPIVPLGTLVNVELKNESEGSVNLALGMNSANDKGECVTYSFALGVYGEIATSVLAGCYWGYGWIEGREPSVAKTGAGILCMDDPNTTYHILIGKEVINFK